MKETREENEGVCKGMNAEMNVSMEENESTYTRL